MAYEELQGTVTSPVRHMEPSSSTRLARPQSSAIFSHTRDHSGMTLRANIASSENKPLFRHHPVAPHQPQPLL
jgi:hypothetical protein